MSSVAKYLLNMAFAPRLEIPHYVRDDMREARYDALN